MDQTACWQLADIERKRTSSDRWIAEELVNVLRFRIETILCNRSGCLTYGRRLDLATILFASSRSITTLKF